MHVDDPSLVFDLDEAIYNDAVKNPYPGCVHPQNAARGRAAEPTIVSMYVNRSGGRLVRSGNTLPKGIQSKYAHDGVLFKDDELSCVIEAKLQQRECVAIPKAEIITLDWCLQNDVPYILVVGKYLNGLKAKYLGSARITHEVKKSFGKEVGTRLDFNVSLLPISLD